jgi:hypothetical protein
VARKPVEPSERVREALWLVRRAAGSDAQVHRWLREYPLPNRKSGRPRNTSLDAVLMPDGGQDFVLQSIADYHSLHWDHHGPYLPDDPRGKRASTPHAVLRRYVERVWRHHEKMHRDKNLPDAVRRAYDPRLLGTSIKQVTHRLAKQLKELRKKRHS